MSDIQRYTIGGVMLGGGLIGTQRTTDNPNGEWMLAEDVDKRIKELEAEIAALKAENESLQKLGHKLWFWGIPPHKEQDDG